MGPAILARALPSRVPYAVRVHRSALEQTVRPHVWRFGGYARQGLATADVVLVGSGQAAEELWEVMRQPDLPGPYPAAPPGRRIRGSPRSSTRESGGVAMRILIFHGYLLRGTGSNIYNVELARCAGAARSRSPPVLPGAQPAEYGLRGRGRAAGRTAARGRALARAGPVHGVPARYRRHCCRSTWPTTTRDLMPGRSPADRRRDRTLHLGERRRGPRRGGRGPPRCGAGQPPGHGPGDPGQGAGRPIPYAVKIHGSALEYTVRPNAGRFVRYAREGLRGAPGCWSAPATPPRACGRWSACRGLRKRPGCSRPAWTCTLPAARTVEEARPAAARSPSGWRPTRPAGAADAGAAEALRAADPARDRVVSFVGKLIVSKGVDLLIAAWPLVVHRSRRPG